MNMGKRCTLEPGIGIRLVTVCPVTIIKSDFDFIAAETNQYFSQINASEEIIRQNELFQVSNELSDEDLETLCHNFRDAEAWKLAL